MLSLIFCVLFLTHIFDFFPVDDSFEMIETTKTINTDLYSTLKQILKF